MGQAAPVILTVVAVVASVYGGPAVGEAILAAADTTASKVDTAKQNDTNYYKAENAARLADSTKK